ncbi:hypothetical protein LZ31DRAFT_556984 [Colletotrichum somersetense]|nr:hypothetical protein LZ31DRAFT_556984 [Colletotrichum somersetense]
MPQRQTFELPRLFHLQLQRQPPSSIASAASSESLTTLTHHSTSVTGTYRDTSVDARDFCYVLDPSFQGNTAWLPPLLDPRDQQQVGRQIGGQPNLHVCAGPDRIVFLSVEFGPGANMDNPIHPGQQDVRVRGSTHCPRFLRSCWSTPCDRPGIALGGGTAGFPGC